MTDIQLERLRSGENFANYDWGQHAENPFQLSADIIKSKGQLVIAECLRDGAHGVDKYPTSDEMIDYIGELDKLGIDQATVGVFSGLDNKIDKTTRELVTMMHLKYPHITPIVLSVTTDDSLKWTGELVKLNPNLKAIVFRGTAPYRMLVQGWTEEQVLLDMKHYISETVKQGVTVIGATEHTTQTRPEFLEKIIETQVRSGATEFCVADTIGIADEAAAYNIVKFVKDTLSDMDAKDILIHWHGHRDMGNDIGNAKAALLAGADRIHAVSWGIGERAGNTAMEPILINLHSILKKAGYDSPWNLKQLWNTLVAYSMLVGLPVPTHGPMSVNATKTQLGIHTDAMYRALELSDEANKAEEFELGKRLEDMANTIYSAIDPRLVGRKHEVRVGPSSGKNTVKFAAKQLGLQKPSDDTIHVVLERAKNEGRILTDQELIDLLQG